VVITTDDDDHRRQGVFSVDVLTVAAAAAAVVVVSGVAMVTEVEINSWFVIFVLLINLLVCFLFRIMMRRETFHSGSHTSSVLLERREHGQNTFS
jgi:hypothetical protein